MGHNSEKKLAIINSFLMGFMLLAAIIIYLNFGFGVVTSGSMEPTIKQHDLVIIRKSDDCAPGDIVVYGSGNHLIVHRVIAKDGDKLTTKGDANNAADDPIGIEDVKGVVIGKLINLPVDIGRGLQAKYVTSATGSSKATVADWNVSVLDYSPNTLEITAGHTDYDDNGYEFIVKSDSDTTAEYHMSISLSTTDENAYIGDLTLGLFRYDDIGGWYEVGESSSGVLEYDDSLPIGYHAARYKLRAMATDSGTAGSYEAHIDVDVTQID